MIHPQTGDRFCRITFDSMGCIRQQERWGTVVGSETRFTYGSFRDEPYALVDFDDGAHGLEPVGAMIREGKHYERHI